MSSLLTEHYISHALFMMYLHSNIDEDHNCNIFYIKLKRYF